ncbi:MAG: hypothetical protein JXQ66_06490 [Campylobacterales bacterium]|nr:hypothetical protein [Campylobacterales bacterium]
MMQGEIKLHDIKPIVEVEEYSFYYFLGVSFIAAILIVGAIFLLVKWYKKRNRYNKRAEHLKAYKNIDYTDTKKAAYEITFYGATFKDDSQRHSEMFANLNKRLENYKYKKEVESFDDETRGYIELYKGMIDV